MNDQQLEDLKQFMDGRISQVEARFDGKFENIETKIEELRQEMLEGFSGVGDAVDEIVKQFDERLTKLEQRA